VDGADPNSIQASVQARGNVLGIYLHGVFEDAEILAALFGGDERSPDPLEKAFEDLARLVGIHMDMKTISEWVQPSRLAGFC
jgi:adenosylcobyric acid synthase